MTELRYTVVGGPGAADRSAGSTAMMGMVFVYFVSQSDSLGSTTWGVTLD